MRHRLVLTYRALAEGTTADQILDAVIAKVPAAAARPRASGSGLSPTAQRPLRGAPAPGRCRRRSCARSRSRWPAGSTACWPATTARRSSAGHRARPDPALPDRRRRPPHRLERHRPHPRAARQGAARRARPGHLDGARRLAVDGLRHRRPAQGRRRRGRRGGASAPWPRGAGTGSGSTPSAAATPASCRRARARLGLLGMLEAVREEQAAGGSGGPETAEALLNVGGLARERSLVVVISDLRGPRDWSEPILQLAGRHDVVAVEVRDPREERLPDVGDIWVVDPETRPPAPGQHPQRAAAPRASQEAAAAERGEVAEIAVQRRRRPRRPVHRGRVAAAVRHLPAQPGRPPVTFSWPLVLVALVLVPIAAGLYLLFERRRRSGRPGALGQRRPAPVHRRRGAPAGAGTSRSPCCWWR